MKLKILLKAALFILITATAAVFIVSNVSVIPEKADAAIILGAAINTPAIYNRTIKGLELYQKGITDTLVLAGGQGPSHKKSEAQNMKEIIERATDETPRLILEDQSHSTIENIKNARKKIPEAKSIVIVSDKFHLARAVLIAKRNGFEDVYWTGPAPTYYPNNQLIFYHIREVGGLILGLPKIILN